MCISAWHIKGVHVHAAAVIILLTGLPLFLSVHMFRINHYCVSQVEEVRDAMENEMRTQLRRQAAAHTDHLRDVLKVQEQELKYEFEQVRTCGEASAFSSAFPLASL